MGRPNKALKKAVEVSKKILESNIDKTINERGSNYGSYPVMTACQDDIKKTFRKYITDKHTPPMTEALDMFAVKIGRLLLGNPNHIDSWHDIAGYATCVENYLKELEENK